MGNATPRPHSTLTPASSAGQAPMALEGVTVLDCTQVMAGPFCTMLLADMGADVIKVEKPGGDDSRRMGPPFINGESAAFMGINRNKRSIVLDLRNEADRSVLRRIAAQADVVAENFRPGTMARLGLGPDTLRAEHPELIWVSISGFGQTGPYASRPGYDLLAQGMSGMMSVLLPSMRSRWRCSSFSRRGRSAAAGSSPTTSSRKPRASMRTAWPRPMARACR